jgi:hypothetical protein
MKKNLIKTGLFIIFLVSLLTRNIYAMKYAWPANNSVVK